jgi:hypothetical protein
MSDDDVPEEVAPTFVNELRQREAENESKRRSTLERLSGPNFSSYSASNYVDSTWPVNPSDMANLRVDVRVDVLSPEEQQASQRLLDDLRLLMTASSNPRNPLEVRIVKLGLSALDLNATLRDRRVLDVVRDVEYLSEFVAYPTGTTHDPRSKCDAKTIRVVLGALNDAPITSDVMVRRRFITRSCVFTAELFDTVVRAAIESSSPLLSQWFPVDTLDFRGVTRQSLLASHLHPMTRKMMTVAHDDDWPIDDAASEFHRFLARHCRALFTRVLWKNEKLNRQLRALLPAQWNDLVDEATADGMGDFYTLPNEMLCAIAVRVPTACDLVTLAWTCRMWRGAALSSLVVRKRSDNGRSDRVVLYKTAALEKMYPPQ